MAKKAAIAQIQTTVQATGQNEAVSTQTPSDAQSSVQATAPDNAIATQVQSEDQKPKIQRRKKNKKKAKLPDHANVAINSVDVVLQKSENDNSAPFADMTPAEPQWETLSTVPPRKKFHQTSTKTTTPWTSNALVTTNRQNDLLRSNFPPLSSGKATKRAQIASSWSKPIKVPQEHLAKDNKPKQAPKPTQPWKDKNEDIFRWAYDNLTPETQHAYLAIYFAKKRQQKVAKSSSAPVKKASGNVEVLKTGSTGLSDLPAELRIRIWKLVLNSTGQSVRLRRYSGYDDTGRLVSEFRSRTRVPALLHVSFETRELAQAHYELAFGTSTRPGYTYFNFNTDKVFLHNKSDTIQGFIDDMLPKDIARVKRVAISIKAWAFCESERALCNQISRFSTCEHISIIAGEGKLEKRWTEDKKFIRYFNGILRREWYKTHEHKIELPPRVKFTMVDVFQARDWQIDNLKW